MHKATIFTCIALLCVTITVAPLTLAQSVSQLQDFWADYPSCEAQCHISVWQSQQCSLANSCSTDNCLVLEDSCLCVTNSWLTAVSQCIGADCGADAVTQAAGIAQNGCSSYGIAMSMSEQAVIDDGLAVISSSSSVMVSTSIVFSDVTVPETLPQTSSAPTSSSMSVPSSTTSSVSSRSATQQPFSSLSSTAQASLTTNTIASPSTASDALSSSTVSASTSSTTGTQASKNGAGGLSTGVQAIIGTVCSIVGVVIAAGALYYAWKTYRKREARRMKQQGQGLGRHGISLNNINTYHA